MGINWSKLSNSIAQQIAKKASMAYSNASDQAKIRKQQMIKMLKDGLTPQQKEKLKQKGITSDYQIECYFEKEIERYSRLEEDSAMNAKKYDEIYMQIKHRLY